MPLMSKRWQKTLSLLLKLLLVLIALIGMLRIVEYKLIYPAPPPSIPWGTLEVQRPDITLHGWLIHPDAPDAWVVFGGNATQLSPIGDAWHDCTDRALYLLPYRGYEGQAGHPGEAALVADGVALVRLAQLTHRHVGIIGISLGSGVATQVAVQARPDKLLLVTPYDRLDLVAQDRFPYLPTHLLMHDTFDSAAAAAKLGGVPVSLLQADRDRIIAAARTRALAAAFPTPPVLWWHAPTGHNGVWDDPTLCRFVRQGG